LWDTAPTNLWIRWVGQILGAIEINGFLEIVNDRALQTVYVVRGCETDIAWEAREQVARDANQQ